MAILDLLRRRRQEEDEEEEVEAAEDADEETEDEDAGGGLLGRLSAVGGLGRVLRRGGEDVEGQDTEDDDASDAEEDTAEVESSGGLLSRFRSVPGLGRVLGSGGGDNTDEDEDGDEDDVVPFPPVAATPAQAPEPPTADATAAAGPQTQDQANATGPQDVSGDQFSAQTDQPPTAIEEALENGEDEPEGKAQDAQKEMAPAAQHLRELARSQEDVPAEELAEDLQELLDLLGRQHR